MKGGWEGKDKWKGGELEEFEMRNNLSVMITGWVQGVEEPYPPLREKTGVGTAWVFPSISPEWLLSWSWHEVTIQSSSVKNIPMSNIYNVRSDLI